MKTDRPKFQSQLPLHRDVVNCALVLVPSSGTVGVMTATAPASLGHLRESDERAAFVNRKELFTQEEVL